MFSDQLDQLPPEHCAQRTLNRARIPQLVRYVLENRTGYVFSSLSASVDAEMRFYPLSADGAARNAGVLHIPLAARLIINDGQHRLAAIREVIKRCPSIGDESISVVLYADVGLAGSQQMFADLNRYAVRPSRSLNILYDHRDPLALLARALATNVPVFQGMTKLEKNSISNRERKLFTLNGIYGATARLLAKQARESITASEVTIATKFWSEVGKHMPDWLAATRGEVSPADLRQTRVHAHGIGLQAIAIIGRSLLSHKPRDWRRPLAKLSEIDWSRSNVALWEGRALSGGKICKAGNHVVLTANAIKHLLGVPLDASERNIEEIHETARRQQPGWEKQDHTHERETQPATRDRRDPIPGRRKAMGYRV